jgi:hypothetical protein
MAGIMVDIEVYRQAYRQLESCTPLRYDCGRLCDRICCRGEDGMWLFPGEEELLWAVTGFAIQPLENRRPPDGRELFWLTCQGKCRRERRPLACRIFPLSPYLRKADVMTVVIDPRAHRLCPLAERRQKLRPEFIRVVGRVCRELAREAEIREFIRLWTEEIEDYRKIEELFGIAGKT